MEHPGKNSFPRHNAVSHDLKDLTSAVALLSDLCHFQHHVVAAKLRSDRKRLQIKTLNDQVFTKCPLLHRSSFCLKSFDFFIR